MQIPDYNPELNLAVTPTKRLPPLDTVAITPSFFYQGLLAVVYLSFFAIVVTLVLFRIQQSGWWLLLPILTGLLLAFSWWRQLQALRVSRRVWFGERGWFLETAGVAEPVTLSGEALVWPWVIILGFKTYKMTGVSIRLVIMQDAVSQKDFRQLSRWLRICLKPHH